MYKNFRLIKTLLALSPTALMLSGFPTLAMAQSAPEMLISLSFPKAQERGSSNRSAGAGIRGGICEETASARAANQEIEPSITALMPENNLATTTKSNPNLYFYVPETNNKQAEFVIFDMVEREEVYDTTFDLPSGGGIMKLTLPKEIVELKEKAGNERQYTWHFGIICNPEDMSKNVTIQGDLKRVSPPNLDQIKQEKDLLKKAEGYAEAKVWLDALDLAVQLREQNNSSPVTQPSSCDDLPPWEGLLCSVELDEKISTAEIIEINPELAVSDQ